MGNIITTIITQITLLFVSQEKLDEINSIFEVDFGSLGFIRREIEFDGINRKYFEFLPSNDTLKESPSLLITLHGAFGGPSTFYLAGAAFFDGLLEPITERGGIILVPQGMPITFFGLFPLILWDSWGYVWNDYGNSWFQPNVDDVGFVEELINWAIQERNVDPSKVFVTGPSGGGSLTYRLLNERSYLFAAAAPLIASLPPSGSIPAPTSYTPVPVLSVHGTDDPWFAFSGGNGIAYNTRSVDDTYKYFANMNGLSDEVRSVTDLRDGNPNDNCIVQKISYASDTVPVEAYIVQGGGHTIPGTHLYIFYASFHPRIFGPVCQDILDFTPVIIDFFDQYGL